MWSAVLPIPGGWLMGATYRPELPSLFANSPRYEPSLHQHPPYSVLDAAGGWWQRRRAYWQALGVTDAGVRPDLFRRGVPSASEASGNLKAVTSESQFSPVLAELVVAYYSEPGDLVLDPFCGGPIRGVVTTTMGRRYHGVDVRREQVLANKTAYQHLAELWRRDDARTFVSPGRERARLALTCPPYHDIEVYSEQRDDLSAMTWPTFVGAHASAVANAATQADWLAWVVGDFRGPDGALRGFPDLVAQQMRDAHMIVWNRHIVRHPLVTAQMRWERAWDASHKATTTHAEVIVGRAA